MAIPPDPQITKLRLVFARADRLCDLAIEERQRAWREYVHACRQKGYCAACEKALKDCQCVVLA